MLTSDLFENKTPAAWRAGYERGLKYYRQGPNNPYPADSEEAKEYADGYHNGELDSHEKYGSMNEGAVKELSQDLRSMSDAEFLARYKMTKAQARAEMKPDVKENWSQKYKSSINCSHPKGFSQKAHCAGKKKHDESVEMEMTCEDCGMCQTHGNNMMEVKQRLDAKCWKGRRKEGTKIKGGIRVNNCVPNEGVAEGSREQVDPSTVWEVSFDYGPHQSDKVKVRASSQEEAEQKGMRAAKKLGHRFPQLNWAMPVEQGVAESYWQDAVKKAEAARNARKGKPFEKNPASHDKQDVYKGDKDLAGKLVPKRKEQSMAEGVAETLPMQDAVKVLKQYGADHFKTTSNELHFYKNGRGLSVDLVMNSDATRSVPLSSLNSATRSLKGQGVAEAQNDYFKRRKDEEDRIAGIKAPAKRTPKQTDYEKKRKQQAVTEVSKATLDRYVEKAVDAHGHADFSARMSKDDPTLRSYHKGQAQTAEKRRQGISRALDRMSKTEGVTEEQLTEQDLAEAVGTLELADFLFKGLEQKFPKVVERYGHEVVGDAIMDVAEENQDVNSVSDVDILIDDIIEKLQNYNGNDSDLAEATVSRLYYNVVGTSGPELRKDFGMRHDRRGWFLSESSGRGRIMDAQRAFGSPKLVEYDLAANNGDAATLGPDNVISPIGTVPRGQQINKKAKNKKA